MDVNGGFYSALDADSEGVEGKFYTWSKQEIEQIIGENATLYCKFYSITNEGNWEHTNILWVIVNRDLFCKENNIDSQYLQQFIHTCNNQLLSYRATRIILSIG
jgi:uncharacterized protein YyaL (SSP411 family)